MPIECRLLLVVPVKFTKCPRCKIEPFEPYLRGSVQRSKRKWFGIGPKRDYCAVICSHCKAIVGYESPEGWMENAKN